MISAKDLREKTNNDDEVSALKETRFIEAFTKDIEKNALALAESGKFEFPESFRITGQNEGLKKVEVLLTDLGFNLDVFYGDEISTLRVGWGEEGFIEELELIENKEDDDE